jgi:hypothetical protein
LLRKKERKKERKKGKPVSPAIKVARVTCLFPAANWSWIGRTDGLHAWNNGHARTTHRPADEYVPSNSPPSLHHHSQQLRSGLVPHRKLATDWCLRFVRLRRRAVTIHHLLPLSAVLRGPRRAVHLKATSLDLQSIWFNVTRRSWCNL